MGLTLIPNGNNTPPHGPMPRMASRNSHRRVFGFSRSLTAIFSTVRIPFASRVGQGNHQQRDCELHSLLRFSLRRTAAFISANEPPTQLLESWRWEANLGLTRRRRFGDVRKREMPEGIHTKGSGSGVITSLGMESGSHAHRSALHPLPCRPCGYLECFLADWTSVDASVSAQMAI